MKSKLGHQLQELMDKPGVCHPSRRIIWATDPDPSFVRPLPGVRVEYGDKRAKSTRRMLRAAIVAARSNQDLI